MLLLQSATHTSVFTKAPQPGRVILLKGKGKGCKRGCSGLTGWNCKTISGTSNLRLPWCICSGECWVSRGCQGRRDWPEGFGNLRSSSREKGNFGRYPSRRHRSQFSRGSGCPLVPAASCPRPAQRGTMYKRRD